MVGIVEPGGPASASESPTFGQDVSFHVQKPVGSASISPCGRDVVLASRQGLHIIDLDSPYSPPRHLTHYTPWEVADVQWSPFAARDYWVVSTSNQKALVWNLGMINPKSSVEHVLHAHSRAITDINFSAHNPDILPTCAVDSFVHCWDLRQPSRPVMTFCDWFAGATQVKWNRQDSHVLASSHDKFLRIWDDRKGAYPLRSIEAHATKIYGVDWSRTESTNLATCSLDRTIKFWDYTRETDEPDHIIRTPFPVWRARHTPFGYGLLAMPQRGDHDLHLYDRRLDEDPEQVAIAIHKYDGHNDQVKEFLWRSRSSITESNDNREFQLVSWGTDRMLRLHKVSEAVLADVGYEKGMEIKRRVNFTRRNAVYKTFRVGPSKGLQDDQGHAFDILGTSGNIPNVGMRLTPNTGMSRASVPFIGGYRSEGFVTSVATRRSATTDDVDPISWMRGVKIGKRSISPSGMHQSVSSIMSPNLKAYPTWDIFESLGEEITHVGEKFAKVAFDEVDMQRRKIAVSLSGPWGPEKTSTYIKARIEFPPTYPETAVPTLSLEKTASLNDDVVNQVNSAVSSITASFLSRQRSSLEAILRYVLGEQTLEESLLWLKKRHESIDLDSTLELEVSSSDEDDERFVGVQSNDTENSDLMTAKIQAQNNTPVPNACGALWANNGCLVCFFPPKPEKEPSFLDLTLRVNDRSSKSRKSIFEGFGRFHNASGRKNQATSTLQTIESGDSDTNESSSSSSGSSSNSDESLPRHHFLPGMAWRGDASEAIPAVSLDESQKSSSGMGKSRSTVPKSKNFVSIHDYSDLLPARLFLAKNYIVGHGSYGCAHNARIAREVGDLDLADVWVLVDLLLQDKVPLEVMSERRAGSTQDPGKAYVEPILMIARRAATRLKSKDSAIDMSYDRDEENLELDVQAPAKWGDHPFGRPYLIDKLVCHYEGSADVQMLAMLSCAFGESRGTSDPLTHRLQQSILPAPNSALYRQWNGMYQYYPTEEVAKARQRTFFSETTFQVDDQNIHSGTRSANCSTGAQLSDLSASDTPPGNYGPLRARFERRDFQATSLSTSFEPLRHTHRSNSNLSALDAPHPRPFSSGNSVASSPPNAIPQKRLSPAGSYFGTSTSATTWSPSHLFGRSSTITEDLKSSFTPSISDTKEDTPRGPDKSAFPTILKHQDQFRNDGYAHVPFLDPRQQKYRHYQKAYAHLLHIWGLSIARAEMLKDYHASTAELGASTVQSVPPWSIGNTGLVHTQWSIDDQQPGPRDHCTSCAVILPLRSTTRRCQNCSASQAPMICLLCNTIILGLSSPCFNCGHVLHTACRELLLTQEAEDIRLECISGCGCICEDHIIIAMETPPTVVDGTSKFAQEEVSPALTVIGDATAATNEQEQLNRRDSSEWEDMAAYDSLMRNLQPKNGVKVKSSQVWRRRNGTNVTS